MSKSFAERLKKAMDYRNISAAQITKDTGISRGMMSDYIHGRVNPKQDKVLKIAKALRINPTWLLGYPNAEMLPIKERTKEDKEEEVHTITSNDIFSADGKKVTGQEILDLINERIRQNKNRKK